MAGFVFSVGIALSESGLGSCGRKGNEELGRVVMGYGGSYRLGYGGIGITWWASTYIATRIIYIIDSIRDYVWFILVVRVSYWKSAI